MDDSYRVDSALFIFTYVSFKCTGIKTFIKEKNMNIKMLSEMRKNDIRENVLQCFLRQFDQSLKMKT